MATTTIAPPPTTAKTKQLTIPLLGMHCANCANTIGRGLKRVPGVSEANVSYANERAIITYDPKTVTPQQLIDMVKDLGYGAALAEVDLPVAGMTCNNCANTITRSLKRVDGVLDVNTSYASEHTHVTYLPSMVEVGDIRRAVRDAGYKVIEVEGASEQAQVDAEQAARNAEIADKRRKLIVGAVLSTIIMVLSMAEMVGLPARLPRPAVAGGRADGVRAVLCRLGLLRQRLEGAQEPHRQHGYAGGARFKRGLFLQPGRAGAGAWTPCTTTSTLNPPP